MIYISSHDGRNRWFDSVCDYIYIYIYIYKNNGGNILDKEEIWKPILGYEGLYEVSSYGRVKSVERDTICKKW